MQDKVEQWTVHILWNIQIRDRRDCDRMVVWFTSCEFESRSWGGVLDTTLCDKVCQWLAAGWWLSPGSPVSSINKTDHHDITEKMFKEEFEDTKGATP